MEDFLGRKANELISNISGTNSLPIFVACVKGKTGIGHSFFHKIGDSFYGAYKVKTGKKFTSLMCKNTRSGCRWKGRVVNNSNIEDKSDEKYWTGENHWIQLPNHTTDGHTCQEIKFSGICQNQFRAFVKKKHAEGFNKFKDIRRVSNLDKELAEAYSSLVGDEDKYGRILTRNKKFLGVVGFGEGFPVQFSEIKVWDAVTGIFENQKFYHRRTEDSFDCFFIPKYLSYMNSKISCDGTFHECKDINGVYQLYCFNVQLYDHENKKTHVQPICVFLLPNKREVTYLKMWRELSEYFYEFVGVALNPPVIHCDNEAKLISSAKIYFPNVTITTCIYHIFANFRKKLDKVGLKERTKTIKNCFLTIQGMIFLDFSNTWVLAWAKELISAMDDTVVRFVANPSHQNKWKEFTKYLLKNWFNPANINFIGSHSNYHKELLYNETPQMTNNPAESLNRVLKSNYDAGRISRSDLAEGLHNFFHARRLKMQVF